MTNKLSAEEIGRARALIERLQVRGYDTVEIDADFALRLLALTEEAERMREALGKARAKFIRLAEFHASVGTPNAVALAKTNHDAATAISVALKEQP